MKWKQLFTGLELSGEGGLRLVGWLETDQGVTWPLQEPGDCLVKLTSCSVEQIIPQNYVVQTMDCKENVFKPIQVFPCPSQPVTIVAALFGRRASQIAKVGKTYILHRKV